MQDVILPEVGENIESGTVVSISVSAGDTVAQGQDLLELETDKASLPVPSPVSGVIKEIFINVGDEVKIGSVIMRVESSEASAPSTPPKSKAPAQSAPKQPKPAQSPSRPARPAPVSRVAAAFTPLPNASIEAAENIPAAPSVRRLARELGIIISHVPGSGPGGRISKGDVKEFTKQIVLGQGPAAAPVKPLPDFSKFGKVRRDPMNNIRKKTAEHLTHCWTTIPHVTQFGKADITDLETFRKKNSTEEKKITVTPFLLKVMAAALKEFPQFNASVDLESKEVIYKEYINIGVAVDTERGLLVPVIRDVDKKSIFDLTDELNEMAERARNKKTGLDELQGGSMTLTNLGGIGGTSFTPIINWPEVAILGVSRGGFEQVYDKNKKDFVPRFTLPLSLSYDHRIIDGADGARFLMWVCDAISKASSMELEG